MTIYKLCFDCHTIQKLTEHTTRTSTRIYPLIERIRITDLSLLSGTTSRLERAVLTMDSARFGIA